MGIGVVTAGDDGSAAFRIPGPVTTNKATLLGVYDVRYNSSVDLQEHIDIGLSRSTDGGKDLGKMRLPLASANTRAACRTKRARETPHPGRYQNQYRMDRCCMDV